MRIWMIVFFLGLGVTTYAQEVIKDGKVYQVKGKTILHEGEDVTSTLLLEERTDILNSHKELVREAKEIERAQKLAEKEARAAEKAQKQAEKAQKKAEKELKKQQKAQKRAEKELKKREKALDRYNKANRKLEQNQNRYEVLKKQGKLSPVNEAKWIKKLDGLSGKVEKARRNL